MLSQFGQAMKVDINRAFATVEEKDVKIKSVIEGFGTLTQQNVASLDTSLRDQVKAEIVDLRQHLTVSVLEVLRQSTCSSPSSCSSLSPIARCSPCAGP